MTKMRQLLQKILRSLASKIIKRYQPKIIGITGSVGKTSTKEAIYTVLVEHYNCRQNQKNYNNEIGVPLSIIGQESGNKNIFAWLKIVFSAWSLIYGKKKNYPEILILEFGADHPGDIKYLVNFAKPYIGVVTAVGPVHLEYFSKIDRIAHEKGRLIRNLPSEGSAILNMDDDLVLPMKEHTSASVITFGYGEKSDIRAHDISLSYGPDKKTEGIPSGLSFKITFKGNTVPIFIPKLIGEHQLYPVLAAFAVGTAFNLNAIDIAKRLGQYQAPPGRMNLIPGIKQTIIIDDSYNSSPTAAKAALEVIKELKVTGRKFAALGDMAELGTYTEQGHNEVGESVLGSVDYLITVGEKAKLIAQSAQDSGFDPDCIFSFPDSATAGRFIQNRIQTFDAILIKGSQVSRMEKIVKELMAEPLRAKELLVRQGSAWQ